MGKYLKLLILIVWIIGAVSSLYVRDEAQDLSDLENLSDIENENVDVQDVDGVEEILSDDEQNVEVIDDQQTVAVIDEIEDNGLTKSGLDPKNFVSEYNGMPTGLYCLKNAKGMEVCITNFGARIVSVMVEDKNGDFIDAVLGFETVADYFPENNMSDFGAAIGRYANRIVGGSFELDGVVYNTTINNAGNTLHGGITGWQYKVWEVIEADEKHVTLLQDSPDGDNGFPGNVKAYITYTLTEDNAIELSYEATTDKPTVINVTNHSHFNIDGDASKEVYEDYLYVNSDTTTEIVDGNLPTGNFVSVLGTPLDFTTPKRVGDDITKTEFAPIAIANGYDHAFILKNNGDMTEAAASLTSPITGINLSVYTDEPALHVYTANWVWATGKHGVVYNPRTSICLESEHLPDSPHFPQFPNTVLRPGEVFTSHCTYAFSVIEN